MNGIEQLTGEFIKSNVKPLVIYEEGVNTFVIYPAINIAGSNPIITGHPVLKIVEIDSTHTYLSESFINTSLIGNTAVKTNKAIMIPLLNSLTFND